jgi:GNAT superfamily N-acetyltransferase
MPALDPDYLTFHYNREYRGVPGPDHDPGDFPMEWTVSVTGNDWSGDEFGDGENVTVGGAFVRIVPDAGSIDLLSTMDAVDSEMVGVAEMLVHERPDLKASGFKRGGDLLVLSAMNAEPKFRGNRTGHVMLRAILDTVGRNTAVVILEAAPLLDDDAPMEGSPQHVAAKRNLRRYWMDFGFREAAGDYLYFEAA